jgi:sugar O-acyltransferase (sialic acid O-acetyltransferase NeuD family)
MEKVVIFGTSAAAMLSHFALTHDSSYEIAAFTVDRSYLKEDKLCGLPVVPFEDIVSIYPPGEYKMMVAVFASRVNKTRAEKYSQAKEKGYELINYVSSKAIISPDLQMGDNCFIGEGVITRPFAKIGNNVIILAGATIGHDAVIKDHCFIAARAVLLGAVTLEPYSTIGANATILDGVTVAQECVIGAGSVIHENTQEKGVYRVNPPTLLPLPSDRMAKLLFARRHD